MGARCFWHAEVCPVDPVWPCVPPLRRDELFSSWLIRCALCHACDAVEFARWLWPNRRVWTGDIDQALWLLSLDALQMKSGIPGDSLMASSLVPLCQHLGLRCPARSITPWILSLGGRNLRRAGGLQYCPLCFADEVPFYRQQWRMAWCTCCPDHGVILHDHCPHCEAVLAPHRLDYRKRNLGCCHHCGGTLAQARTQLADKELMAWELRAEAFFHGRKLGLGWPAMPVSDAFAFFREIYRLLHIVVNHPSANGAGFLASYGIETRNVSAADTGLVLECLPVEIRAVYLKALEKVLAAGEQRFITALKHARFCPSLRAAVSMPGHSYISQLMPLVPANNGLRAPRGRRTQPHCPPSVLRAWLRFKRRMLRSGALP